MYRIFNLTSEKDKRKTLRKQSTQAEKLLWTYLRRKSLGNLKFRRQHSVRKYILDFYCSSCKLAIELDGEVHNNDEARKHDKVRDQYLKGLGIKVLRFSNEEVFNNVKGVLMKIREVAGL